MTVNLSDYFAGPDGEGVNGLTMQAYKAAGFGTAPVLDTPLPGSPDATAVTANTAGGPGAFQLTVPTSEPYWVGVSYSGHVYWKLYPLPVGLVPTAVKTGNYNAKPGDYIPCDTNAVGAFTVTLPTAPPDGTRIGVKIVTLGAGHAVTIACGGSDVFNKAGGSTTASLSLLSQAQLYQYAAGPAIWYVVADDLPLSQLIPAVVGVSAFQVNQPTLSSQLSTGGGNITSLPVTALAYAIPGSGNVVLASGVNTQTFAISGAAAVGATSIPVTAATPNFNYPTTTHVQLTQTVPIPAGAKMLEVIAVGGGGGGGGSAGGGTAQIGSAGAGGGAGQASAQLMAVGAATTLAVIVGNGGLAGTAGAINQGGAGGLGGTGQLTSVTNGSTSQVVSVGGGTGGQGGPTGAGSGTGGSYGTTGLGASRAAGSGGNSGAVGGAGFGYAGGGGGGGGAANGGTADGGKGGAGGIGGGPGAAGSTGTGDTAGQSAPANSGAGGGGAPGSKTVAVTGQVGYPGGQGGSGFAVFKVVG